MPVQNIRTGLRAIVFGNGKDGTLDLRFMPINADVEVGDTLVTSGIDGTYPPGIPVAKVIKIEHDSAYPFLNVTCLPIAGVDNHRHLLILSSLSKLPSRPDEKSRAV